MRRAVAPLAAMVLVLAAAGPLRAQTVSPIEEFVQMAARLWASGNADSLVELVPEAGRILLDTGNGGGEAVNGRHAAAALRALFSGRENVSVTPVRATLSGGDPVRGFGELTWVFRVRGAPMTQTRSVYVGAVWTGERWSISEIRLMP